MERLGQTLRAWIFSDSDRGRARLLAGLLTAFVLFAFFRTREAASIPSLMWMNIWMPDEFKTASLNEIAAFFLQLRVPIPIPMAAVEIASIKLVGTTAISSVYGYRFALIAVYGMVIYLARSSPLRMLLASALSFLFLHMTMVIHPGNPQGYDIFFPFMMLLFVLLLQTMKARPSAGRASYLIAAAAGFALSMAELIRPFVIFVLPVFLAAAFFIVRQRQAAGTASRNERLAFLLPLLLFSGTWHAYQFAAHGQIALTNHTGFNLARAWPQAGDVERVREIDSRPRREGHYENINTPEHAENSRRLQRAVMHYWMDNPAISALHGITRIEDLLSGRKLYDLYNPSSQWFGCYWLALRLLSALLIVNAGLMAAAPFRRGRKASFLFAHTDNLLVFATAAFVFFLAVGEQGEEARFLISILPLLATVPLFRSNPGGPALHLERW